MPSTREIDVSSALAVDDVGDLVQIHRRAALVRDDDALEAARILDLAFDANQLFVRIARNAAGRQILVRGLNRRDHLIDADAIALQLLGTQEDLHLALDGAADDDIADAGRVLQALDDLLVDDRRDFAQAAGRRSTRPGSRPAAWLLSLLAREIVGSRTSRGMAARICATLSRTSCVATTMSTSRRNVDHEVRDAFARGRVDVLHAVDRS